MSDARFREEQRFRQRWLWAILGLTGLLTAVTTAGVGAVVVVAVALLFYRIRLTTEVREDGVYVQFEPFHRSPRHVPFEAIGAVETERVGLLTYGGLGIRFTPGTVAYLTTTGDAVRLVRPGRRTVVVGTAHPREFVDAIDAAR